MLRLISYRLCSQSLCSPDDGSGGQLIIFLIRWCLYSWLTVCLDGTGYPFQGRFASAVMNEAHLLAAACYMSLNPVRARLVARAEDRPWLRALPFRPMGFEVV